MDSLSDILEVISRQLSSEAESSSTEFGSMSQPVTNHATMMQFPNEGHITTSEMEVPTQNEASRISLSQLLSPLKMNFSHSKEGEQSNPRKEEHFKDEPCEPDFNAVDTSLPDLGHTCTQQPKTASASPKRKRRAPDGVLTSVPLKTCRTEYVVCEAPEAPSTPPPTPETPETHQLECISEEERKLIYQIALHPLGLQLLEQASRQAPDVATELLPGSSSPQMCYPPSSRCLSPDGNKNISLSSGVSVLSPQQALDLVAPKVDCNLAADTSRSPQPLYQLYSPGMEHSPLSFAASSPSEVGSPILLNASQSPLIPCPVTALCSSPIDMKPTHLTSTVPETRIPNPCLPVSWPLEPASSLASAPRRRPVRARRPATSTTSRTTASDEGNDSNQAQHLVEVIETLQEVPHDEIVKADRPTCERTYLFLWELLHNERFNPSIIKWVDKEHLLFEVQEGRSTLAVAQLWAIRKGRNPRKATWENFARAIRYSRQRDNGYFAALPTEQEWPGLRRMRTFRFGPRTLENVHANLAAERILHGLDC